MQIHKLIQWVGANEYEHILIQLHNWIKLTNSSIKIRKKNVRWETRFFKSRWCRFDKNSRDFCQRKKAEHRACLPQPVIFFLFFQNFGLYHPLSLFLFYFQSLKKNKIKVTWIWNCFGPSYYLYLNSKVKN